MNEYAVYIFFNPWHTNIIMHILHTVLHSFPKVVTRRICLTIVVSSRLSQVTSFIAIAQLNFIKESTSYIHNTVLGISNTTFT